MSAETKTCPKCNHTRQPDDPLPDYECPKCGVVYAKAMAPARPGGPKVPAAWLQEEPPVIEPPAAPIEPPPAVVATASKLIDCAVCSRELSFAAAACPHCGHPNPDAPSTHGLTAGLIALGLAVSAVWMPYFAAPLLIPAAVTAVIVAFVSKRAPALPAIATIIVVVAILQTYQTSQQIKKAAEEYSKGLSEAQREAEAAQQRWRYQSEKNQRELDNILRQFGR